MILTIETSTDISTLGIFNDEYKLLRAISYESRNDMAQNMFKRLDFLLDGAPISDISLILTTIGPGSFTGVRIGVITAKMLAMELNIPIIGVSALTALAMPYLNLNNIIMPVINARRKELYFKLYSSKGTEIEADSTGNEEKIRKILSNHTGDEQSIIIAGITKNLPDELSSLVTEHMAIHSEITPENILNACLERIEAKDFDDPLTLAPIYLRSATDR